MDIPLCPGFAWLFLSVNYLSPGWRLIMDRKLEHVPSLTGSVVLIVRNSLRHGLFGTFGREHRGETHRERESGMSDTAAGCEQTCKRTEHSPALLAIGFDAVTYTEKWRRCCGIVHRLFLPSSAFYGAAILFIDLTCPPIILFRPTFYYKYLVMIRKARDAKYPISPPRYIIQTCIK